MYLSFYGLKENPFNVTSDPSFFFMSRRHKEAFSHLIYGIKEKKGFLEITGEIGTGKTTLCRVLLNQLDKKIKTAFILNPNLSELQLLQAIAEDFGLHIDNKNNKLSLLKRLNDFLIEQLEVDNNVILILDEAQNISLELLEKIRMLSNLETEKEKLFQIILVGQPQLREKLRSPELEQLKQRIGIRYHIYPLDEEEIEKYIYHRLNVAGFNGSIVFSDDALKEIYKYSRGIPRLINLVCDKALLLGYVLEAKLISLDMIKKSIREIEGITE
ncbi:MAG: ATPase [Candidatus Omnitrophica bacterium CG07_land_8_20_14_0_80_42_15]|uniref:ATPase n=1 Tax=Candidatus Aquitaenariimonas noxiae TaxID=1974741 RepID=A0A2J0KRX1_9BACT|nr:MAG: ATPase [Candidatus Omnitrophica bacterium CG07_land_8_20_14_0_80_42_15]